MTDTIQQWRAERASVVALLGAPGEWFEYLADHRELMQAHLDELNREHPEEPPVTAEELRAAEDRLREVHENGARREYLIATGEMEYNPYGLPDQPGIPTP